MCDGETSTLNKCAMARHRLKDNKKSWQRWRNINKTDDKTSRLTMILSIKVGQQTCAMVKHRLQTNVRWRNIDYEVTKISWQR